MDTVSEGQSGKEQRLGEIIAAYLEAIDAGWAPPREDVVASYPDLAADLSAFFVCQDKIARLALPTSPTPRPPALDHPLPETTGRRADTRAGRPDSDTPTAALLPPPTLSGPAEGLRFVGDYELLAEIRHGGMGVVYRARQKSLNRIVALKMMRSGPWATLAEVQRFRKEAEEAANLDHPNIVPIYEVGEFAGRVYFSMKLFESGSLTDHLDQFMQDQRRAAQLVARVARAVHHAHQCGLLHRDLKPGNILLDKDGAPHVTDFGLAKRLQPGSEPPAESIAPAAAQSEAALTEVGAVVGTPGYMSPEQVEGKKSLTTAVDVYGLGAVLYKLLTGRPPFEGANLDATLRQVAAGNPRPPRALNPRVDVRLEAVCLKCLEKDPQRRYRTAEALAEDLERWLAGEPPLAWPQPWWLRTWRAARRDVAISLAVAGCAFLTAFGLLAAYFDPDRPLYKAQARLANGQPVELLGATGPPVWWHWSRGEDATTVTKANNEPFALATLAASQVKLLPDPETDAYHYRAEVRHDEAVNASQVGIYFGYRSDAVPTGVAYFWCTLEFADRGLNTRTNWPRGQELKGKPTLNKIALRVHRQLEPQGEYRTTSTPLYMPYAPPAQQGVAPWRQLAVEVDRKKLRVFWDGKMIPDGEISIDSLNAHINMAYKLVERGGPKIPFQFAPRGALGLYMNRGKASFRNVAVEPLR